MERRNLILAIILTLLGILILVMIPYNAATRAPREGYMINVSPRTFPYIMGIIMTAIGAFNVVIAAIAYKKAVPVSQEKKENTNELKSVFIMFVIMFVYILLLGRLGYIISTIMAVVAVGLFFKARLWQAILLGILLPPIIYLLFTRVGVPLPRGILYFF